MTRLLKQSAIARVLIALSVLYPIIIFSIFPKWLIDDALIGFRYSENLAIHGALTWNLGEPPVEGYTGLALPVAVAGFMKVGIDPTLASHLLGISSFFLGLLFLYLILRLLNIKELIIGVVLLLYATTPMLFTHATSGLETTMFVAALFLSLYHYLAFLLRQGNGALLSLSLLLLSLVRPEGVAFSAAVFLFAACFQYRNARARFWHFIAIFFGIYFLPALVYFVMRFNYYGALLPNTFYAKQGKWSLSIFLDIMRFLRRNLAVPLFAAAMLLIPQADFLWHEIKRSVGGFRDAWIPYFFAPCALFSAALILFLSHSHLITNFSTRFYIPLLPFIWLTIAALLTVGVTAQDRFKEEKPIARRCALAAFVVLCSYQVAFQMFKIQPEIVFAREEKIEKESQHYRAGQYLHTILSSDDWLVVYLDAGAVSYFSRMKVVDFGALNDIFLARNSVSLPDMVDYFYSKNPAALFFTSTSLDKVAYTKESDAITADPRFKNYVLAKKYPFPFDRTENYHELLFLRADLYEKLAKEGKLVVER